MIEFQTPRKFIDRLKCGWPVWAVALIGLLPEICAAQAPQAISVPQAAHFAPPPTDGTLAPLLAQLRSGDELTRTRAMLHLGNFNLSPEQAGEAIPLLLPALHQWPSKPYATGSLSLQSAALVALWGVGPEGRMALPEIATALDFDEMGIRDTAMNAVSHIRVRGTDAAVVMPAVIRLLEFQPVADGDKERHPAAVEKAVRWLADIGPAARPAVPALIRALALADRSGFIGVSALQAIGRVGPEASDALPALISILERDDNPSHLQYLVQAIAQVGLHDPRLRDPFLAVWQRNLDRLPPQAPDPRIFSPDVEKLRLMNGLVFWLGPTDATVVRAVIRAIGEAPEWALISSGMDGNGMSVGPIRGMSLGNMAESFLGRLTPGRMDTASDFATLVRRSADRPKARRLAFFGLQKLGAVPDEFLPVLQQMIEPAMGPGPDSMHWAYQVLESMGPRAAPALPLLRKKLHDPSEQYEAARVLAAIGRPAAAAAIPELEEAAAIVRVDDRSWDPGLLEPVLTLEPGFAPAQDVIESVISTTTAVHTSVEGHRILLEHGSNAAPHRAALTAIMNARDDEWAAVAATVLARDRREPAARTAAIDRLFRLLDPLVAMMTSMPSPADRSGSQSLVSNFSATYGAAIGLEALLPRDADVEPRLARLVRTLWEGDRRSRDEFQENRHDPQVQFLVLIRILALFESKAPATQALLAELEKDPQFPIREAAIGYVNNGR